VRSIALLVLACVACSDRYGSFLDVDGQGGIVFDRVEFYFGKEVGGELPTSPMHPVPSTESSVVAKRMFADADVQSTGGPVGTLTYYLPDDPENEHLGRYVAVLAYQGSQLVGIGELFDFTVQTNGAVYRYPIELVDPRTQDLELWGRPTADCLRWTRERPSGSPRTVAIVRDGDTDCDDFHEDSEQNGDCMPRVYCDGTSPAACEAQITCVTTSGGSGCQIGFAGCSNLTGEISSCTASTCIDERACSDCDFDAPATDAFSCVVLDNNIHVDSVVIVNPDFTLCSEPFDLEMILPAGLDCVNPTVVGFEDTSPGDEFAYSIASGAPNTCKLTITPKEPDAHFTGVPHLLVSIDTPSSPAARTAFVIGLQATDGVCQNPATITPELSLGRCVE
jgi:hypothetical protein